MENSLFDFTAEQENLEFQNENLEFQNSQNSQNEIVGSSPTMTQAMEFQSSQNLEFQNENLEFQNSQKPLLSSKIIISRDFESVKNELVNKNARVFEYQNMLVENAKAVIAEAYVAEYEQKNIIIFAQKIMSDAQNALLKILEEPPKNIVFTIVVPSKNTLLPTICSRLIIENKKEPKIKIEHGLDLLRLDLKSVLEFSKKQVELKKFDKVDAIFLTKLVNSIVCDALRLGIKFSPAELDYLRKLSSITALNTPPEAIFTPLLLLIMKKTS